LKTVKNIYLFISFIISLFYINCSNTSDNIAGSSVNSGNAFGRIYNQDGSQAPNTQVQLIPSDYDPLAKTSSLEHGVLLDTTNEKGEYIFENADSGTYNIEAIHLKERTRLLIKNIEITPEEVEVIISEDTLRAPGTLVLYLPESMLNLEYYFFIPGTNIYTQMDSTIFLTKKVVLDSVPLGNHEAYYSVQDSAISPVLYTDSLRMFQPSLGQAATYFVSLSGSDTNDGLSVGTAFRTINNGAQVANAGDTVLVKPGNYGFENISLFSSGISDNYRIVIKAETPGSVILGDTVSCLDDACRSGIAIDLDNKSFITIDGFEIRNYATGIQPRSSPNNIYRNNILRTNSGQGINLRFDCHNTVIENNQFIDPLTGEIINGISYGVQNYGVSIYESNNVQVLNNYFYGRHHQAVSFIKDNHGGLVSGNTFDGSVASVYLGETDIQNSEEHLFSSDIIVENNVFRPAENFVLRWGVVVRNVHGAVLRNNFIEGLDGGGFGIYVYANAEDVEIYNNVICNSIESALRVAAPISLWNNTFINTTDIYLNSTGDHFGIPRNGQLLEDINNIVVNNYDYASNPNKFAGPFTPLNKVTSPNPQFTPDFSRANLFRLQSNSPLVNTGTTVPAVVTDFNGITRPQGFGYDIGAFEFNE